jgi:hypothetical protein
MYQNERLTSQAEDHESTIRPAVIGTRPAPAPLLARSLTRTAARSRLQTDLRAIAVDLLGRCQPSDLPDAHAAWVARIVDTAVMSVCDSSLAALAEALDAELEDAPPGVVRCLEEAEVRRDAGYV